MKDFDISLEARQLKLFLSLVETQSLTKTAEELGVGQPAVSHALGKLRQALGDPLFVRSGRGIKATAHALSIVGQVREISQLMGGLAASPAFDPSAARGEIVIGANEYQRDMLLPALFQEMRHQSPELALRIVSNPYKPLELLRDESVDLVLTPIPPHSSDVHLLKLNTDRQAIFYDANRREAPRTENDFLTADYVVPKIIFDEATGYIRREFAPVNGRDIAPKIVVNTTSGLPHFLRGSDMLCPMPGKLALMKEFSTCHVPGTCHSLSIHVCWHQRNHNSPLHQWLIEKLQSIANAQGCLP